MTDNTLIIDVGEYSTKFGFSNNELPTRYVPTVRGKNSDDINAKYCYGDTVCKLNYDTITSFVRAMRSQSIFEEYMTYLFGENNIYNLSSNCNLLYIDNIKTTEKMRRQHLQTLFEKFKFQEIQLLRAPLAVMGYYEKRTGIVFDSSDCGTFIYKVINGKIDKKHYETCIGGKSITMSLLEFHNFKQLDMCPHYSELKIWEGIKEGMLFVANDLQEQDNISSKDPDFNIQIPLPSMNSIQMGQERYAICETLFSNENVPTYITKFDDNNVPLPISIQSEIETAPEEIRLELSKNILISGGNTLFEGFNKRMEKEMKKLNPESEIHFSKNPREVVWVGAKKLLPHINFISRKTYEENGAENIPELFDWYDSIPEF